MISVLFVGLLGVLLAILPFIFQAGAEGRYRRGVGWYFDARTPRDVLMKQHAGGTDGHEQGASPRAIRIWLISGIGLLAIAVVTWVRWGSTACPWSSACSPWSTSCGRGRHGGGTRGCAGHEPPADPPLDPPSARPPPQPIGLR